jgi:hypothetical protein
MSSLLIEKTLPEADEPETATDSVAIAGGTPGTGRPEGVMESLFSAAPLPAPASAAITDRDWKPRLPAAPARA